VIGPVIVAVIDPVIVAVHVNGNATVDVIGTVDGGGIEELRRHLVAQSLWKPSISARSAARALLH